MSRLSSAGPPFTIYRNRARYDHPSLQPGASCGLPSASDINQSTTRQVSNLLAENWWQKESDLGPPLGSLLQSFLASDIVANHNSSSSSCDQRRSTLVRCCHGSADLIVHSAGKHMDQLVIRHLGAFVTPHVFATTEDIGFSLSIGQGEAIVETLQAGSTNWGESANLLSTSRAQVTYTRTLNLGQCLPPPGHPMHKPQTHTHKTANLPSLDDCIILEPVQKWQLPDCIVSSTASSSPSLALAAMLSDRGAVYTWSPLEGLLQHATGAQLFGDNWQNAASATSPLTSPQIEYSLHPSVLHAMLAKSVHQVDLRTSANAHKIITASASASASAHNSASTSSNSYTSICQHASSAHHLVLACQAGTVSLFDLRFPKHFVSQQHVPFAHRRLSFTPAFDSARGSGIVLGSSASARQLICHEINMGASLTHRLLACHQPTSEAGASWQASGFPVVERASPGLELWGTDLVPLPTTEQKGEQACQGFFLLQQSSIGDVYAQKILVSDEGEAEGASKTNNGALPCGVSIHSSSRVGAEPSYRQPFHAVHPSSASPCLTRLERSIFPGDCLQRGDVSSLPAPASSFVPYADDLGPRQEGSVKVIRMRLEPLRAKAKAGTKARTGRDKLAPVEVNLAEALREADPDIFRRRGGASTYPMTLWEARREAAAALDEEVPLEALRSCLRSSFGYLEECAPAPTVVSIGTSDGLKVVNHARTEHQPEASQDTHMSAGYVCSCFVEDGADSLALLPCSEPHCRLLHLIIYVKRLTKSKRRLRRVDGKAGDIDDGLIAQLAARMK